MKQNNSMDINNNNTLQQQQATKNMKTTTIIQQYSNLAEDYINDICIKIITFFKLFKNF